MFPHETPRTGLAALTGRGFLLGFPNETPRDPVSAGYIETSVCSIVKFNWQNIVNFAPIADIRKIFGLKVSNKTQLQTSWKV